MKTITQLRQQFIEGSETPAGALADTMKVINEKDKEIHAFLDVYDDAKAVAESATETFSKKDYESKPLLGVPIAVKNNILVKGKKATGASKILECQGGPVAVHLLR